MSDDHRPYHSSLTTGGPLPLTPLIDMVFLIVIFFMINAAFAIHSVIPVELPGAVSGAVSGAVPGATELIITVAADGRIYLDRDGAANAVSLNDLRSVLTGARDLPVVLRGDARAAYGGLVAVMDAVRAAGITDLSLVTVAAPAGS